jgi:hypothetical protein
MGYNVVYVLTYFRVSTGFAEHLSGEITGASVTSNSQLSMHEVVIKYSIVSVNTISEVEDNVKC